MAKAEAYKGVFLDKKPLSLLFKFSFSLWNYRRIIRFRQFRIIKLPFTNNTPNQRKKAFRLYQKRPIQKPDQPLISHVQMRVTFHDMANAQPLPMIIP